MQIYHHPAVRYPSTLLDLHNSIHILERGASSPTPLPLSASDYVSAPTLICRRCVLTPLSKSAQNIAMRIKTLNRLRLPTNSKSSQRYVANQSPLNA